MNEIVSFPRQDLANRYSSDLNIPFDDVLTILETLRVNALQKLADREKFQKSGLATLKVRLAGQCPKSVSMVFSTFSCLAWKYILPGLLTWLVQIQLLLFLLQINIFAEMFYFLFTDEYNLKFPHICDSDIIICIIIIQIKYICMDRCRFKLIDQTCITLLTIALSSEI